MLVDRPAVAGRRIAEAERDRKSDGAARLQAGADADAETGDGILQRQFVVAERLPGFLQGSARGADRRSSEGAGNNPDKANNANETQRSRTNKEDSGITDFAGSKLLAGSAAKVLPGRLLTTDSTASSDGKGSVNRQEALQTNVAAVVTQLLPNGNLVVEGKQEIRVNFEIRELIVAGIVRPEDIQSDNTIDSSKIAQARIAYGGRGQIMDVQQPRYGQQVMDVLLPF